jgi:hypothetical protein
VDNETQTQFDMNYGKTHSKTWKMKNEHCRTWNMAITRKKKKNEKLTG